MAAPIPVGALRTRDAAAVMGGMHVGRMVLDPLVARRAGLTPWADIGTARMALAILDLYATVGEYIASPVGQRMRAALDELAG